MKSNVLHSIAIVATIYIASANAATPVKPYIALTAAKSAVMDVMQPSTGKNDTPLVISVVDEGGNLIYLERADGAPYAMVEASIMKARSAAGYGVSTKVIEQEIVKGSPGFQNLPGVLPMEGGSPVVIEGRVVGAVGVAGGVSADDGVVAQKTASALSKSH
jgi:glc operon protein GlcG